MNLQELLDKLPPEDRQAIIDHFARNVFGQGPKEEVVIRRTVKISTLGSEDEMINEISKAFNIPKEQIKNQNIAKKLKDITEGYHKTSSIINEYKDFLTSKKAPKDKFEELYDLGKFLVSLGKNCLIELPNSTSAIPDFIILLDNKRIGIEHTRLMNSTSQIWMKTVSHILKKAENILLQRKPDLKQIVNISVNYWKLNINGKTLSNKLSNQEKEQIARDIADYLDGLLVSEELTKPSYIDRINISEKAEHPLNLILNENYIAKPDSASLFAERIREKEAKLKSYLTNNSLDELWLLVVISGVTASSSFILHEQDHFDTRFDKVFLFDNFSHEFLTVHSKA